VFESLSEPWFETPWRTDKRGYIGEDVFFCRKARAAGFRIYIEPRDLLKRSVILALSEFKHDHTWVMRDLEKAKEAS